MSISYGLFIFPENNTYLQFPYKYRNWWIFGAVIIRGANNQIFLDCLAMLRASYIERDSFATFQSVILAGVHDVENLRRKASCEDTHRINSPWNIAADFDIDMNFSVNEISTMLKEYELDYHTGMNIREMAELIYEYTSGYPMLVSKLCKLMDEEICRRKNYERKSQAWTREGFQEAIKITLSEKNMLFESLGEKLIRYPELKDMLRTLLFTESKIAYNVYESSMNIATMFGFVKNNHGVLAISNRIFATWLYNLYLSENKLQAEGIYKKSGK